MLVTTGVCPRCRGNHKKLIKKLEQIRKDASEKAALLKAKSNELPQKQGIEKGKSLKVALGYLEYLVWLARLFARCSFDMEVAAVELMCSPERARELVAQLCLQFSAGKQRALKRKAAGLCTQCSRRKPARDYTLCRRCLKRNAACDKRRELETGMTKKNLYHSRKEKGLCIQCGKRDASPGRVMCQQCRDADALRVRERARRARENSCQ